MTVTLSDQLVELEKRKAQLRNKKKCTSYTIFINFVREMVEVSDTA